MRKSVLLLSTLIVGCVNLNPATMEVRTPAGPQPSQEAVEAQIKALLSRSLKDPDSLKQYRFVGLYQTRWMRGTINGGGADEGWLACVEYNGKNSYGAYTGVKPHGFIFRAHPDGSVYEVPGAIGQIGTVRC